MLEAGLPSANLGIAPAQTRSIITAREVLGLCSINLCREPPYFSSCTGWVGQGETFFKSAAPRVSREPPNSVVQGHSTTLEDSLLKGWGYIPKIFPLK